VSSSSLSIIVADDHPLTRAGIQEVLSVDRFYNLVAVAETGAKCIELMQRLRPDAAIIDINISHPGAAGILHEAKHNRWQTRICFLTEDPIPPTILESGADAASVFVKARFPSELRDDRAKSQSICAARTRGGWRLCGGPRKPADSHWIKS